jgi:hypothetical protein
VASFLILEQGGEVAEAVFYHSGHRGHGVKGGGVASSEKSGIGRPGPAAVWPGAPGRAEEKAGPLRSGCLAFLRGRDALGAGLKDGHGTSGPGVLLEWRADLGWVKLFESVTV